MNSFIKITKNLRLHEKKNRIIKSGNIYLIYNTFIGYDFEETENNKEKHRKIFSEKYNYYLGNYICYIQNRYDEALSEASYYETVLILVVMI